MIRAQWKHSRYLKPQQIERDPEGLRGQRPVELWRAVCGRKCREPLAKCWGDNWNHRFAFRLPEGFVYRREQGLWELPERFQEQRRRWVEQGFSASLWHPTRRRRVTWEEYEAAVEAVIDHQAIPGVLWLLGAKAKVPQYLVDPMLTGGVVAVRCPHCGWPNEVGPPPLRGPS